MKMYLWILSLQVHYKCILKYSNYLNDLGIQNKIIKLGKKNHLHQAQQFRTHPPHHLPFSFHLLLVHVSFSNLWFIDVAPKNNLNFLYNKKL